jgi:hypothetical protein
MEIGLKREQYYEGTMPDLRELLIGFGKWLQSKKISGQGTLDDYEIYCCEYQKQKEKQRENEYTDFLCYLFMNKDYEFAIIEESEWNEFYADKDKEDMDMKIVCYDKFYQDGFGIDLWKFESCFVSGQYIDDNERTIKIELMFNNEVKGFIVDLVY